MAFASEALMHAAEGDVETLVCGADLINGIFFTIELPVLMKNGNVTSINGVSIERLREIHFSGRENAAYLTFHKICQGELTLVRQRIEAAGSEEEKQALREEYKTGRTFFILERRETIHAKASLFDLNGAGVTHALTIRDELPIPPAYQLPISHPNLDAVRLH